MDPNETEVQAELQKRQVKAEVAKRETAKLAKTGWILAAIGWAMPVLIGGPGAIPMLPLEVIAAVIGILMMIKGNMRGGITLLLAAWIGSLIWFFLCGAIFATLAMHSGPRHWNTP